MQLKENAYLMLGPVFVVNYFDYIVVDVEETYYF
jgi:hypothetical protein